MMMQKKFISLGASRLGTSRLIKINEKYRQWCRILISENEELKIEYSINDCRFLDISDAFFVIISMLMTSVVKLRVINIL